MPFLSEISVFAHVLASRHPPDEGRQASRGRVRQGGPVNGTRERPPRRRLKTCNERNNTCSKSRRRRRQSRRSQSGIRFLPQSRFGSSLFHHHLLFFLALSVVFQDGDGARADLLRVRGHAPRLRTHRLRLAVVLGKDLPQVGRPMR